MYINMLYFIRLCHIFNWVYGTALDKQVKRLLLHSEMDIATKIANLKNQLNAQASEINNRTETTAPVSWYWNFEFQHVAHIFFCNDVIADSMSNFLHELCHLLWRNFDFWGACLIILWSQNFNDCILLPCLTRKSLSFFLCIMGIKLTQSLGNIVFVHGIKDLKGLKGIMTIENVISNIGIWLFICHLCRTICPWNGSTVLYKGLYNN